MKKFGLIAVCAAVILWWFLLNRSEIGKTNPENREEQSEAKVRSPEKKPARLPPSRKTTPEYTPIGEKPEELVYTFSGKVITTEKLYWFSQNETKRGKK